MRHGILCGVTRKFDRVEKLRFDFDHTRAARRAIKRDAMHDFYIFFFILLCTYFLEMKIIDMEYTKYVYYI